MAKILKEWHRQIFDARFAACMAMNICRCHIQDSCHTDHATDNCRCQIHEYSPFFQPLPDVSIEILDLFFYCCCRWSLATWLVSNILLCMVPRYGAYMMLLTGTTMIAAAVVYSRLLPTHPPLVIRFETNSFLSFDYGWCFWIVVAAGERHLIKIDIVHIVRLAILLFAKKITIIQQGWEKSSAIYQ